MMKDLFLTKSNLVSAILLMVLAFLIAEKKVSDKKSNPQEAASTAKTITL